MKKISRRTLLKTGLAAGSLAALTGAGAYKLLEVKDTEELFGPYPEPAFKKKLRVTNTSAPKPNVILIYCDDLGYGDLSSFGSKSINTPRIDSLGREGVTLTDYHACNGICAPSRAGLLTGRYPFRTGIMGNTYPKDEPKGRVMARNLGILLKGLGIMDIREEYVARGISPAEITLAEGLKSAGYATCMVGKWHLGDYSTMKEYNPIRHGFDHYLGVPYSNDMLPYPLYRNEQELIKDMGHGEKQAELTGRYTRETLKFIEESRDKPFFIYFAHTFPHKPIHASKNFKGKSRGGIFGDAVEEIDWSVGQLLDALDRHNIADNTLVIFTSDNGPWYEGSAGELRGGKGMSYEGGFRVPFLARWPKRIPRGIKQDALAINLDLYPTILKLAGVELPDDRTIDGKDILPLLTGKSKKTPHEALYFYHYDQLEGLRTENWKYIRKMNRYAWPIALDTAWLPETLGKKQLGNRWPLLYNLGLDPSESYNVIQTHPDKAKKLEAMLKEWEKKTKADPRGFKK